MVRFLLLICDLRFYAESTMVAKKADGVLHHYVSGARLSWVDVDNVAEVAAYFSVSRIACRQNVQTWL
jgi:hypothetical protein